MTLSNSSVVSFCYHYKATPKGTAIVLAADFTLASKASTGDMLSVFWGPPPKAAPKAGGVKYDWVPSDKVYRVVRVITATDSSPRSSTVTAATR